MNKADLKASLLTNDVEGDDIPDRRDELVQLALHKQYEEERNAIEGTEGD